VEVVKAGLLPDDFGEQAPVLIEDLKDVTVDVDGQSASLSCPMLTMLAFKWGM
jgi:hypothetical protein